MSEWTFEQKVTSFWSRVNKDGPVPPSHPEMSNCWIWEGCKNHRNYGTFCVDTSVRPQKNKKAHAMVFFFLNGFWPKEIDHLCHVTLCVRPDHIREVLTHQENMNNRRCSMVCRRGHKLEDPNLQYYTSPSGKTVRRCIECIKIKSEEEKAARRARGLKKPGRKANVAS